MSIVVTPIANISVSKNADNDSINLFRNFDDPFTTGLVATFKLYDTSLKGGISRVVLFDQQGKGAPLTVQNFRNYVNDGDYKNSFIHRSVRDFVVQGGGFVADGVGEAIAQGTPSEGISPIPTDKPVKNEFSRQRSNVRGTIAMAKLGTDPNSATSQWFFNLGDNSSNLDNQNGGFTVFGKVMAKKDFAPIQAIANLPIGDVAAFFQNGALQEVPFINPPPTRADLQDENFVRYRSITVNRVKELSFKVTNNTNTSLVDAQVNRRGKLILDYAARATGKADITVQATNLLGQTAKDTFRVTVQDGVQTLRSRTFNANDTLIGTPDDDELKGRSGDDILDGGLGNDTIATGSGQDIVRIGLGEGVDLITDFHDGRDRLQLTGGLSFDDLSIVQKEGHTSIRADQSPLLHLANVDATTLTAVDFV